VGFCFLCLKGWLSSSSYFCQCPVQVDCCIYCLSLLLGDVFAFVSFSASSIAQVDCCFVFLALPADFLFSFLSASHITQADCDFCISCFCLNIVVFESFFWICFLFDFCFLQYYLLMLCFTLICSCGTLEVDYCFGSDFSQKFCCLFSLPLLSLIYFLSFCFVLWLNHYSCHIRIKVRTNASPWDIFKIVLCFCHCCWLIVFFLRFKCCLFMLCGSFFVVFVFSPSGCLVYCLSQFIKTC